MAIRGVVFDKDGTLFDFQATWGAWCAGVIADLAAGDPGTASDLARVLDYDLDGRRFRPESAVIAGTVEVVIAALRMALPGRSEGWLRDYVRETTSRAVQVEAAPLGPLLDRLRDRGGHESAVRIWIEGLPTTDVGAGMLLDDLARG